MSALAWADAELVSVHSFGEPIFGQDLDQANGSAGAWQSQVFRADVLPRHSYTLSAVSRLDPGSTVVVLQAYFVTDLGVTVTVAPLEAHAATPTAQVLSGIVAPLGASELHYVLKGEGSSVSWWKYLRVVDDGLIHDGIVAPFEAGGLSFTAQRLWVGEQNFFDVIIPRSGDAPQNAGFAGSRLGTETVYRLGQGHGLVHVSGDPEALRLTWDACDASRGATSMGLLLQAQPGDAWILPFNEGLRVPIGAAEVLGEQDLAVRSGHFISLPLLGIQRGDGVLLLINETPDDSNLRFWPHKAQAGFRWLSSKGSWSYPRSLRLQWIPHGGVSAMAAAYRRYAESVGSLNTLAEKSTQIPGLAKLAGALDLHYFKRASYWSRLDEPADAVQALLHAGLDRVLWSQAASLAGVMNLSSLGYLPGRYENFQDAYPPETALQWMNTEGWPQQLVLTEAGTNLRGWAAKNGQQVIYAGVRNSEEALRNIRDWVGRQSLPYQAVFFDTTTASSPLEDWSTWHPLVRGQDLDFKRRQLEVGSLEHRLITGSESGHDGAINAVHYFEGMLSPWCGRFDDAGYDLVTRKPATQAMLDFNVSAKYRVPLFELAYHDCVVNYPYWGDASNRLPEHWRFRDLLSCLYGQPQLWVMDDELWAEQKDQAAKSYATWSPVVRHLFGQKLKTWQALDEGGQRQETRWEDGSVVRVDFAKARLELEGPVAEAAKLQP